jgi:hypothetical protein
VTPGVNVSAQLEENLVPHELIEVHRRRSWAVFERVPSTFLNQESTALMPPSA